MTTLTKSKSGNGNGNGHQRSFPTLANTFFKSRLFGPSLFDLENELLEGTFNVPPANISESKTDFKVSLSAPGLKKDEFKVEVENGLLVISGEKKEESKEETENFKRREFSYNSFSRSFELPENILDDKINAKYEDGVLNISIPKKEQDTKQSKKAIKVG